MPADACRTFICRLLTASGNPALLATIQAVLLGFSLLPGATVAHGSDIGREVLRASHATHVSSVRQGLLAYYDTWKGVPHRMGGLSRRGIDCSGFVYRAYRDVFGITLPRSTQLQARTGDDVPLRRLSAGDLVFFRISRSTRHVGIYLGNARFMHASKSRGVMISSLDNPYWRAAYWRARRVMH
ncbi:MAG: NlpC/P60 family protein [Mariprofundaceae bacterium]|nr:NlpC/P60 family protein [Mariprofundaceae bacterium]